jgi:DNA-binding SARP family transcriptional activator
MGRRLEFGLLGPLLVTLEGTAIPLPQGRQRTLLAALLLNRGQLMSADQLIEVLWGSAPPASARASLQNYVKRLRKALGDAGHSRILTQHRGYAISVDDDEFDVSRFEALLRAARTAIRAGAWDRASSEAHAALSLWRGEPLADVDSEALARREIPRLAEMRWHALEVRLDADLHLGRHADVIPELRRLASVHPLRERLHELLMLALYRDGRRAEALAAYQQARHVLIDELGAEPGTGLRELHQQILTADPALAVPAASPEAASPEAVSRQRPARLPLALRAAAELAAAARPVASLAELAVFSWSGREIHWARWLAAAGGAVAAAGVLLWAGLAGSGHQAGGVTDGTKVTQNRCGGSSKILDSQSVRNVDGAVLGSIELRYSASCAAGWARFSPAPYLSQLPPPLITVEVMRPADGKSYWSRYRFTGYKLQSRLLLLDRTCLRATATIVRSGRPPLTVATACLTAP